MRKREKTYLPDASAFPVGVPADVIDAVRGLYETCSTRRATWPLNACTGCCMDAQLAREMCDWDLKLITQKHIRAYQEAAHEATQDTNEYLCFFPRIAEMISHGDTESVRFTPEIALDRLGQCDHEHFSVAERDAIERWCHALWQWWLDAGGDEHIPLLRLEADALLIMFGNAGLALDSFLTRWQQSDTAWAVGQFGMLLDGFACDEEYMNSFVAERPEISLKVRAWSEREDVYLHFAEHWSRLSDAESLESLFGSPYFVLLVTEKLGRRDRQINDD